MSVKCIRSFVQKEKSWTYDLPKIEKPVMTF